MGGGLPSRWCRRDVQLGAGGQGCRQSQERGCGWSWLSTVFPSCPRGLSTRPVHSSPPVRPRYSLYSPSSLPQKPGIFPGNTTSLQASPGTAALLPTPGSSGQEMASSLVAFRPLLLHPSGSEVKDHRASLLSVSPQLHVHQEPRHSPVPQAPSLPWPPQRLLLSPPSPLPPGRPCQQPSLLCEGMSLPWPSHGLAPTTLASRSPSSVFPGHFLRDSSRGTPRCIT